MGNCDDCYINVRAGYGDTLCAAHQLEVVQAQLRVRDEMLRVAQIAMMKTVPMVRGCSDKGDHDDSSWCDEYCGDYGKTLRKALAEIEKLGGERV